MNILVCVKQVPDTTEIRIDPKTNTLMRDGAASILNPFDAYALENAARLKERGIAAKLVVLTMGPPQAEAVLRECLSIAADTAYLLSDRAFGGSDTLATSYILRCAVRKIEETEGVFDAVFCGKQAIDGDTAQVGPELAEHLGYPQVTSVLEIDSCQKNELVLLREAENCRELVGVMLPCVATFTKPVFEPRFPSIKRWKAARKAAVQRLAAADLSEMDLHRIGLQGSPTKVKRTFAAPRRQDGVMIQEINGAAAARQLYQLLSEAHVI